ncbi:xanthine dehydrogenase family protein molybdopterin-binding subunit [Cupriavidus necator]|uniref:xanthine dehydrogenase family protein molybdopterin-binding subunit n=1 Tax=Cupriavidus necator TaxID=106590 RepID=UPI0039C37C7B
MTKMMEPTPDLAALAGQPWIGRRLERREDARHLEARAQFVADVELPGCQEVAFVRSPVAHGHLRGIRLPQEYPAGTFWTAADLAGDVLPISCALLRDEFNGAPWPLLAVDRVRFVGEAVVMVVAPTRAQAETLAEEVELDIEVLPPVVDAVAELATPGPVLHAGLSSNVVMRVARTLGDFDAMLAQADAGGLRRVTRQFAMDRVLASPLETRGCVASADRRSGHLTLYLSTQRPHLVRSFVAEQLTRLSEAELRVIVPDVGGGFGAKSNLYPEEVLLAALALRVGHPLRWIEDRYEHFVASNHSRQHAQEVSAWFDASGRIHGIDARIVVDSGAYSAKTSTGAIEANMAANVLLGPYDVRNYRFEAVSVYTNKSPLGPYRGVGRPGGCFAMERIVDEVAHALRLDPVAVRRRNLIPPNAFPYTTATGLVYDSGNYAEALDAAVERVAAKWGTPEPGSGRWREGIGYAMLVEQAAHGAEEWRRRGSPAVYGHESARATLHSDGSLEIEVGTLSHGQGHQTSLAQIAAQVTTLDPAGIHIRQGDTAAAPFGMGTVASRSIVMAGGAVRQACAALVAKARSIGAVLVGCPAEALRLQDGKLMAPDGRTVTLAEVARVAYIGIHQLPREIAPGMSAEAAYRPEVETGTFSYAVHAARVRVDIDTGLVRVTGYVVAEDCGTVVNPLIVDGQIIGGVAQGIGQALYEAMRYNADGQPETVTFGDYHVPSAVEIPPVDIIHLCTPSPFSAFGVKGMGEGGSVPPPAAIANAVRAALKEFDVQVCATPITPDGLLEQLLAHPDYAEVMA